MEIVKFKNGKYGIRKLTLIGYQFAINGTGHWSWKNSNFIQEFDSLEEAKSIFEKIKQKQNNLRDMGEPM